MPDYVILRKPHFAAPHTPWAAFVVPAKDLADLKDRLPVKVPVRAFEHCPTPERAVRVALDRREQELHAEQRAAEATTRYLVRERELSRDVARATLDLTLQNLAASPTTDAREAAYKAFTALADAEQAVARARADADAARHDGHKGANPC